MIRLHTACLASVLLATPVLAQDGPPREGQGFRSADLSPEDRAAFLVEMKDQLSIRSRQTGPFGLPQERSQEPRAPWPPTPPVDLEKRLQDVLAAVPINGYSASGGYFLVGARELHVNDTFFLLDGSRRFDFQVRKVTNTRIHLFEKTTGLEATIPTAPTSGTLRPLPADDALLPEGAIRARDAHATPLPLLPRKRQP